MHRQIRAALRGLFFIARPVRRASSPHAAWLRRLLLPAAVCLLPALAAGQGVAAYPERPIRLIVPVPPGGASDLSARALAEGLHEVLGQQVIVDNRPGASGMLGTTQAGRVAPDGYTLLLSLASGQITAPLLLDKPVFDGLKDFTPIGQFIRFTTVLLVHPAVPAGSFKELVAYAKQHPGMLNYGSTGIGGNPHLTTELLKLRTGTDMVHVPYKGGAAMVQALVGNEIQVLVGELNTSMPWIQSGQLKPLLVFSEQRSPLVPDVPTAIEEGVFDEPLDFWMGLAGPKGLPDDVVQRLNAAMRQAMERPQMQPFFEKTGSQPVLGTPEALQALWEAEHRRAVEVIGSGRVQAN